MQRELWKPILSSLVYMNITVFNEDPTNCIFPLWFTGMFIQCYGMVYIKSVYTSFSPHRGNSVIPELASVLLRLIHGTEK